MLPWDFLVFICTIACLYSQRLLEELRAFFFYPPHPPFVVLLVGAGYLSPVFSEIPNTNHTCSTYTITIQLFGYYLGVPRN